MTNKIIVLLFVMPFSLNCSSQEYIRSFYFDHNLDQLNTDQKNKLFPFLDSTANNFYSIAQVEAFCDTNGSIEFNLNLAERRLKPFRKAINLFSTKPIFYISTGESYPKNGTNVSNLNLWRRVDIHYSILFNEESNSTISDKNNNKENLSFKPSVFDSLSLDYLKSDKAEPIILNIEFYPGTDQLFQDSYLEVDKLYQFIKQHEDMEGFIRGHVCCGSDMYLSYSRAFVVYNYMIQRGVSPKRISLKGFDNTIPLISPELTDEDRQRNRRVDVIFSFPKE